MITLLTGDNSYAIEQEKRRIIADFNGDPESYDGTELELKQIPNLIMGLSLFAEKRLVIIRDLSANKHVWEELPDLLEHMSDTIHVVLIEPAVDKRLRTYKTLQKIAEVISVPLLTERDTAEAELWMKNEAQRMGIQLDKPTIAAILARSLVVPEKGPLVIDQWQIYHTLEKLSVFDTVTVATVEQYIDAQSVDSVFSILETALNANRTKLHQLIADIESREDPYRVFGLLSGQIFQMAALAASDGSTADTAKAVGIHPYAASKLASYVNKLSHKQVQDIVRAFAEADDAMKLSKADPWTLIEQVLMKVTRVVSNI